MKKLLVLFAVLMMVFCFTVTGMAVPPGHNKDGAGYYEHTVTHNIKYFSSHPGNPSQWIFLGEDPPNPDPDPDPPGCCDQYVAQIAAEFSMHEWINPADLKEGALAGGQMRVDVDGIAQALATGKDYKILWWSKKGSADADGFITATAMSADKVFGNIVNEGFGHALTIVKSASHFWFAGNAEAEGTPFCDQYASVDIAGTIGARAFGVAKVAGLGDVENPQAIVGGEGLTTVAFNASDVSPDGFWESLWTAITGKAEADIEGFVLVKQGLFLHAYVNPTGTVSMTFGMVTGGAAKASGDAEITSITSSGQVSQAAYAQDGGAVAFGSSSASFNNVEGYVASGSYASGSGVAVVSGFNAVQANPGSLSVMSSQHAHASSGCSFGQVR